MTKSLSISGRDISVQFDYDTYTMYKLSSLPKKTMIDQSSYLVPFSFEVLELLQKWEFKVNDDLKEFIAEEKERKKNFHVSELNGELKPFQNTGVNFINEAKGRCLIADEMGTGKTIQAIGYIAMNRKVTVIICPASIKLNWQREIEKWINDTNVEILKGTKSYKTSGDILILNYDIAYAWIEEIKRRNPQILILDELTKIKHSSANRTKAILKLKTLPHIIGLSGTPIENRPEEIYNAGKLIRPDLFGTFAEFKRKYCNGNGFGHEYNGTKDLHLLNFMLTSSGFMIRRLKKDVLSELPEKTFSFVPIELSNRTEYAHAENDLVTWLRNERGIEKRMIDARVKFEYMKQIATKGKLKQVKEWIKDFLETENKLVVFCTHKFVVDALMNEFSCAVKIDGSTTNRQTPVDMFQNDPKTRLFIGNSASETGITLTASSNIAHIEYPWNPSSLEQRNDRCHRIGQKYNVNVYYLLAQDTIEEKIIKLLDKKRIMIDSAMDGINTPNESLLTELLKMYK